LLQERIRQVPNDIKLQVGLDETLTDAEKAIAIQRLQAYSYIELRSIQSGEQVQVLLGRLTDSVYQRLQRASVPNLPAVNSIGLFTATQEPINDIAFGQPGESVESLIDSRLAPQLKSLLIGRILALMVNQNAARLNVTLSVEHNQSRSSRGTRGGAESAIIVPVLSERGIEKIPVGDRVTITVQNHEPQDLHIGLLVIDAEGEVDVLHPVVSDDVNSDRVQAGRSLSLGPLRAVVPYGLTELLVIASPNPLQQAIKTLQRIRSERRGGATSVNPDEVMRDIFSTLETRRGSEAPTALPSGTRSLDVTQVAALSLLYEIIPASSEPK